MPHRHEALFGLPPPASTRLTRQTCLAQAEAAVQERKVWAWPSPLL